MTTPHVIAHGGAGHAERHSDGPRAAAEAGLARLFAGDSSLDAAVAAAVILEDDPRFNAGTGSYLRFDGRTIEMDAAVMTSDGRFGAVLALQRTKNPILAAEAVTRTPHLMLAGEGAERFARRIGLPEHDVTTVRARAKHARLMRRLAAGEFPAPGHRWEGFDVSAHWNFAGEFEPGDTIGAVARAADGTFAVANSTGGTATTMLGRVGDSPIYGAGLYAGECGAVAATGEGEEIVKRFACLRVYERMAAGASAMDACRAVVGAFPASVSVGLIALDATSAGFASTHTMPVGEARRA